MQYIVVLEKTQNNPLSFRFLVRATVPLARQPFYANAEFVSAYPDTPEADLVALRAGQVTELVSDVAFGNSTVAQIKAELIQTQQAFQAAVNAAAANKWQYYGTSFDGTTWTNAGVS